ncbi:MAG: LTA synthase family protein [Labilithrix sp.]|nr:LTA synthase family protein [Labilithrix sp.]
MSFSGLTTRLRARRREGALVVAALLPPLLARLGLLVEKRIVPGLPDLHGLLADLVVAVLVAVALVMMERRRWQLLVVVPWSIANHASYEFTKTLNAVPPWQSIGYLGDATFVKGSALVVSNRLLFAASLVLPLVMVVIARRGLERANVRRVATAKRFLPAAVVAGVIAGIWPADRAVFAWRQTNFVANNASDLVRATTAGGAAPLSADQQRDLDALFRADLAGVARLPFGASGTKPNVLLVLLESVSGTDLPSVAALHQHPGAGVMHELDAIGRRNVYFRNFITHQRGTNRGLYMSLCGDYDKLGAATSKMTEAAAGPSLDCLPAVLRRNGYETVFLQAAPLAFMLKDAFMPKSGFSQTMGGEVFDASYARSNWGVDDRAFFERTRKMVGELRAKQKPWMMTLLTVGTHHPYPVPASFEAPGPPDTFERAARYADVAVAELVRGLEEDGALEDTAVLITSDESHGDESQGDDLSKLLTQNLSFMIAVLPGKPQLVVDELFGQTDTALSVLDLVGLEKEPSSFIGRSVFRQYATPRRVLIANQNERTVGMVGWRQRNVWSCDEHMGTCDHIHPEGGSFVAPKRTTTPMSRDDVAFLRAAQERAAGQPVSIFRELSLASDRVVPVRVEETVGQLLFAGQYLEVPAGAVVDVDLELEVSGEGGEVVWTNDLVANYAQVVLVMPPAFELKSGERAVLRYTYAFDRPLTWVEARSVGRRVGATDVAIRFKRATMRIRPGPHAGPPGLTMREHAIDRGAELN